MSLEQDIRTIADAGLVWASMGVIETLHAHDLVDVLLHSGRRCQARRVRLGARDAGGLDWPVVVGDEVLVVFPGADPNAALAIAGLTSRAATPPNSASGDHVDLVHPGGLQVRASENAQVEAVLRATTFQSDLNDFLGALNQFMTTALTVVFGWQVPPIATAFQADPRVITFVSRAASGFYSAGALRSE